jgi:hypothetical protein
MPRTNWEPIALQALTASLVLAAHALLFAALMSLVILSIKWNGFKVATTEMPLLKAIGQDCKYFLYLPIT